MLEKKAMIDSNHPTLSIARQCELINLSRASYYRAIDMDIAKETPENLELMRLIDEEYMRHPFYGSRKIRSYFCRQGRIISRKRIQRLMRIMGLMSVAPKPYTSKRNKEHKVYPYLLRDLIIDTPNQVWCTDITYIRMQGGFVYLVAIMDWYSRKVLSWEISNTMEDSFCISALDRAIRFNGIPEIFNTDQGTQFTSTDFINILKQNDIKISMDGKGRWVDNVFIERLWRSIKYEDIYLKEYQTVMHLRQGLNEYFIFYNEERPHQSFDIHTPAEVYSGIYRAVA
jgi:putative transposase